MQSANCTGYEKKIVFLNSTAAFIWEKLENCNNIDELVQSLVEEFEVEENIAKRDALTFILFLTENGCLEPEGS